MMVNVMTTLQNTLRSEIGPSLVPAELETRAVVEIGQGTQ